MKRFILLSLTAALLLSGCQAEDKPVQNAPPGRLAGPNESSISRSASQAAASAIEDLAREVADLTSSIGEMQSRIDELTGELEQVKSDASSAAEAAASAASAASGASSSESSSSSSSESSSSELDEKDEPVSEMSAEKPKVPDVKSNLLQAAVKNEDAVLWIQIPGTGINDPVVQGETNTAYSHRDWMGNILSEKKRDNAVMLDFECDIGSGTAASMPQNTVIYGVNYGTWLTAAQRTGWDQFYDDHYNSFTGELEYDTDAEEKRSDELSAECERLTLDDPNGPKFSQLLQFADFNFAKKTPYIYLTTKSGDIIYEVFAAGYTNSYTDPPYNLAGYSDTYFENLVRQMKQKSLYQYDVTVTAADKILTLSTDTFRYAGKRDTYGDRAKFVVMGRLMKEGDAYRAQASITQNPSPVAPVFVS